MTDQKLMQQAYAVPLHEQLASVPENARLEIDDPDGMGTRFFAVGRMCHEAASALRAAIEQAQPDASALHKMIQAMTKEHWRSIDQQWKDDPELCHALGYEAGFNDAVDQRAEPPAAESGAGFESLPASPKWQGLTDSQIGAVAADIWGSVLIAPQSYQAFARAIEAKLREKNA